MNELDAKQLAEKITRTWRGGTGTEIWYDVLLDIEYGPAEVAWRELRDREQHQPSIAQFKATYKAQLGTAHEERSDCPICDGDGWQTVEHETYGLRNAGVKPCRCRAGRDTERVHRNIIAANNAEFDRLGLKATPTRPIRQETM